MPPEHLTVPVDALQVERVGADAPDHRAVVAWVLAIGRAAVKGHAADAAHIVACSGAGGERVRGVAVQAQEPQRPVTAANMVKSYLMRMC